MVVDMKSTKQGERGIHREALNRDQDEWRYDRLNDLRRISEMNGKGSKSLAFP